MLLYSAWQILSGTSELLSRQRGEIFINIFWSMPFPFLMFAFVIQSYPNATMDLLTSWTQKVPLPAFLSSSIIFPIIVAFLILFLFFFFFLQQKSTHLFQRLGGCNNRHILFSLPPSLPLFATLPSCLKTWSFTLSHPPSFHSTRENEENSHLYP